MNVIRIGMLGAVAVTIAFAAVLVDRMARAHSWLFQQASINDTRLLFDYLKFIVPVLWLTSIIAGVINRVQQKNSVQKSFTRFLFMKSFFWAVVEFGLFFRLTNIWLILDFVSFTGALLTSVDFDIHIVWRYVLDRREKGEVLP